MVENKRYVLEWFLSENKTYAKCQVHGLKETHRYFVELLDDISRSDSCKP
jgi:hypothetical protein